MPLPRPLHKLYHPAIFQGSVRKHRYFEGWYVKLVTANAGEAMAFIPGIALYDSEDRHAFIQVLDGVRQVSVYHRFPLSDFRADRHGLDIRIGNNRFSENGLRLDLTDWAGEVRFGPFAPLKRSLFSPGIMGWYAFVPRMQCYHGVVSLRHGLSGSLAGPNGTVSFDGGKGYIEKDWGSSFPACWIWCHTNHFSGPNDASLMASVAHIPWMGSYFPGFITVLWLNGKEYRFATYNGSRIRVSVGVDQVDLAFRRGAVELRLSALHGPTAELRSPLTGRMTGRVNESLQAIVEATLVEDGRTVWHATGTPAGLEVAGDTGILETQAWRR